MAATVTWSDPRSAGRCRPDFTGSGVDPYQARAMWFILALLLWLQSLAQRLEDAKEDTTLLHTREDAP
ncbi:MAG: hypothetical protein CME19_15940 [Gemmatimonadetes bacterium]|nr:hypothetical protein [Gemmatimonadota bacterium]